MSQFSKTISQFGLGLLVVGLGLLGVRVILLRFWRSSGAQQHDRSNLKREKRVTDLKIPIRDPGSHIASHIEDPIKAGCVIIYWIYDWTVFSWSANHRAQQYLRSTTKRKRMWTIATLGRGVVRIKRELLSSTRGTIFTVAAIPAKQAATFSENLSLISEIRRSKSLAIVDHPWSASSFMTRTR